MLARLERWGLTSDRESTDRRAAHVVPMCAIYAAAILAQMARWYSPSQPEQIKCLTNNRPTDLRTRYRRVGSGCPTRRCHIQPYFPAGVAMGAAFLFWGLITTWVVWLVGVVLLSQHSLVGSPNFVMNTSLTESSTASLAQTQRISASGVSLKAFYRVDWSLQRDRWSTIGRFHRRALFSKAARELGNDRQVE